MKTAVDSSVLLDVLAADPIFGPGSREALRAAFDAGTLVACDVVWAEVRAHFHDDAAFDEAVAGLDLAFSPLSPQAARLAGELWRKHHARSSQPRSRVVADFLIGAHAQIDAEALLTRDRGFFRRYFSELKVLQPAGPGGAGSTRRRH